ncbi:unnamed protein product [Urochloa decumbens]|uniref:Uncharacterized protein n=1 Tax=Urochloa decumbens TaxID=240449 RepID=A0ABC9AKY5_9POAL
MAAVLDAMAPYVQKLITDMAEEEVSMLLGVSGEITKLEDNMEGIKAFLADAERRRLTDESVRRWVSKLKGAMYDASDILDLCQLEADNKRTGGNCMEKVPGCFQPFLFCLRNPVFAHRIGSRIKELNQPHDQIRRGAAEFNFLANSQNRRTTADAEHSSSLKTMSEFDETAIVRENIERDTKGLAQVLLNDENHHDLKVVSIVGMGGMGKTTLAQKNFNEPTVQKHFKVKVWLSITQQFDEAELLRTAIEHAGGVLGGAQDKTLPTRNLTDALSAGRFLLVLDDMWSDKAWSDVFCVPARKASQKQLGSRILITTRLEHLAPMMGEYFHQHHVRPLDIEDAWSLLKKQLPPDQVVGIDRLKNTETEILKKCEGLPLAIKVIGGLLSTRYPSERDWNVVLTCPTWSVAGLPEQLDSRIYLSYEDLSPQLKQCFMYCSLFPKGEEILEDVVVPMWISEGFIQPPDESSSHEHGLEEMATEYYRELIRRNLIEPAVKYSLTGYRCTMHDVVHTFAEYMARKESVVVVDDKQAATCGCRDGSKIVRHPSVGQTISAVEWVILQKQKSLRTLIIRSSIKFQPGDTLRSFSSLQVLFIRSAGCDTLVGSLSTLKHLRYLHLEDTDVSRLLDDIHNMKFLQYIHLLDCEKLHHLPRSIVKFVHLRSLDISGSNVSAMPKGFGGLTNLRSLFGFPVYVDDVVVDHEGSSSWCSLQELAHLSQLRQLTLHSLQKVPASWMAGNAMLSSKAHLSYLELNYSSASGHTACHGGEADEQEQQRQPSVIQEEVLEKLCPPTYYLEHLVLERGYAGRQLPYWMHAPASAADFKSLRFLQLERLPCCTQLPDGLCFLPCLQVLVVKDAPAIKRIGPEFQAPSCLSAGHTAAALAPPFPKLINLKLVGLFDWEEWQALRRLHLYDLTNLTSVENFPSVVKLDVFRSPKLKRISGLSSLHEIRIVSCPNLEVLEGVPSSLDSLALQDHDMEALPGYLRAVNPRYLRLHCSKKLYRSLSSPGSSEWSKIRHIEKHDISYNENCGAGIFRWRHGAGVLHGLYRN